MTKEEQSIQLNITWGHEYDAKPSLLNFYKQLDPTNRFNPGIGKTTKLKDWKQV